MVSFLVKPSCESVQRRSRQPVGFVDRADETARAPWRLMPERMNRHGAHPAQVRMKPSHSPSAQASVLSISSPCAKRSAHLGQRRLGVDLLGDLRRRRRCRDRQRLMLVGIGIVEQRALRRPFLGPGLQGRQLLERRQIVAAAGRHELLDRRRLRQMRRAGSWPLPCSWRSSRRPRSKAGTARSVPSGQPGSRGSSIARRPAARRAWRPPRRSADS